MKVKIHSQVIDGKLKRNRNALATSIKEFEGKDITITIERKKKNRSIMQNSYYWAVIVPLIDNAIRESWGERYSREQIHELLKKECNYVERHNESTGEIIKVSQTTTNLSTIQFEEYEESCRRWALEWFNIIIPLPNEQIEIKV